MRGLIGRFHMLQWRSARSAAPIRKGGHAGYVDSIGGNTGSEIKHKDHVQCRPAAPDEENPITAIIIRPGSIALIVELA